MAIETDADHAAEYERLRAELADFVVGALAERAASGEAPQLSQALADAIDRRVDQAVQARLAQVEWPDPDAFADQVIAAAGARGFSEGEPRTRTRPVVDDTPRAGLRRGDGSGGIGGWSWLQIILVAVIGIAIVAAATYFLFSRAGRPTQSETINDVTFVTEPTPDGGSNMILPPPANVTDAAPVAEPARNEIRRR